jgi:hypothetical protein
MDQPARLELEDLVTIVASLSQSSNHVIV